MIIESFMYFGIGFLLAALSVLGVAPLVHGRAVRLTVRRMDASIPQSMAEVQADKDLLRAEFAMSTRRLEFDVEQLRTKSASQLSELGRKGDAINRLNIELGALRDRLSATEEELAAKAAAVHDAEHALSERESELAKHMSDLTEQSSLADAQKTEILTLKTQVEALKVQLEVPSNELKTLEERRDVEGIELKMAAQKLMEERSKFENFHRRVAELVQQLMEQSNPDKNLSRRVQEKIEVDCLREQLRLAEETVAVKTGATRDTQRQLSENETEFCRLMSDTNERSSSADAQKVGTIALKTQLEGIEERLTIADNKIKPATGFVASERPVPMDSRQSSASRHQRHAGDAIPVVPEDWRAAKVGNVPDPPNGRHHEGMPFVPEVPIESSLQPNGRAREGAPCVPTNRLTPELAKVPNVCKGLAPNDRHHDDTFSAQDAMSPSSAAPPPNLQRPGADALPVEPKVWPKTRKARPGDPAPDFNAGRITSKPRIEFARTRLSTGRRTFRAVARLSIAALVCVGGLSLWQFSVDRVVEKIVNRVTSLDSLPSTSTTNPRATSPELVKELETIPRDLTFMRQSVERLIEKQKQIAQNIATLQATELRIKKKAPSSRLHHRVKLTAWPETRPTTIPGWTLRGITNGTAILEGPNGLWRAMRGDTVPGVGRVESLVRWGNRLIVATSSGLISTP